MIKSDYLENSNKWFFGPGLYGHLILSVNMCDSQLLYIWSEQY